MQSQNVIFQSDYSQCFYSMLGESPSRNKAWGFICLCRCAQEFIHWSHPCSREHLHLRSLLFALLPHCPRSLLFMGNTEPEFVHGESLQIFTEKAKKSITFFIRLHAASPPDEVVSQAAIRRRILIFSPPFGKKKYAQNYSC